MKWRRVAVGALGVGVFLLAWAVGEGHVEGFLPVADAVELLGNDYFLVAGLAGLTLAVAAPVLASGRAGNRERTEMPDPEEPITMATPGDGFDELTGRWTSHLPVVAGRRRREVADRLRQAAVSVVARSEACSRAEAERRVDAGEWSTDPVATAFVAHSMDGGPAAGERVRAILGGETALQRRARRTIAAVVERDGGRREVTDGGRPRH